MSCLYKYQCYPHVLHYNEVPDKDILAKAVAAHLAKTNIISTTVTKETATAISASSATDQQKGEWFIYFFILLLHYFTYFIFFFILLHEGSDIPDQTLFPCASCTELVNSDMKCSLCEKPMHVFCSAVELEDGVGDAVCTVCLKLPCAVCQKLVNGDCKCERCHRNMHVSCSVFPTTDRGRNIMCFDCTYVNESDADDNVDAANDR